MKEIDTDILIIGAGLVGLVAAHCMSLLKYNVVLIDKKKLKNVKIPDEDNRTVAVSEGSKQFLNTIFLWDGIEKNAKSIKKIKVFDRSSSNKILFENPDKDKKLGYVIENFKFTKYFLEKINKKKM